MHTLKLLLALLLTTLVNLSFAADQPLRGTVIVRIVDSVNGEPVAGAAVTVRDVPGVQNLSQYVQGYSVVDIPHGTYVLSVRDRGWVPARTTITVDAPRIWKTIGLTLESPEYGVVGPKISGTMVLRGQPAPLAWIKVVAVYSDMVTETVADGEGKFTLAELQDGLYMIYADAADGFASQSLRLLGKKRGLVVELLPRHDVR